MGGKLNTSFREVAPSISPDGRYIFFTSNRRLHEPYSVTPITYQQKMKALKGPGNGEGDIYWVDARVIEEFRPRGQK